MRVRVHAEPPLRLSAIVGDCLYTLRSSLDQLAWQLASLNGPPPSGTEFPIFTDCGAYHRLSRGKPARGSGLYKTRGIAPAEQALIEQSQPYNRPSDPEADPLWILHSLCNIDKAPRPPPHGRDDSRLLVRRVDARCSGRALGGRASVC